MTNEFFLATGNEHKVEEFRQIFPDLKFLYPKQNNIVFSPNESGSTFFENAFIKAKTLYDIVEKPVMADDSGLCVNALDGKPGIHSARYGTIDGHVSDNMNILRLLTEMKGIENRKAHFVCCLLLYFGNDRFFVIEETCHGEILTQKRGENGFGYDPVFYIPELKKTMAELTPDEKNSFSHRGRAGRALTALIKGYKAL